jgi:hypothetical protein
MNFIWLLYAKIGRIVALLLEFPSDHNTFADFERQTMKCVICLIYMDFISPCIIIIDIMWYDNGNKMVKQAR